MVMFPLDVKSIQETLELILKTESLQRSWKMATTQEFEVVFFVMRNLNSGAKLTNKFDLRTSTGCSILCIDIEPA